MDVVWQEQARRQLRSTVQTQLKEEQKKQEKLKKQRDALKQEVLKSLTGESAFETELLQTMLADNKAALDASEAAMLELAHEKENEEARLRYLSTQYHNIRDWAEVFDTSSTEEKKMILSRIIRRIEVDRNYHLTIEFFVTMEDFESRPQNANVDITETEGFPMALPG